MKQEKRRRIPNNEETGNKETNGEALTEENASVIADSKEEFEED